MSTGESWNGLMHDIAASESPHALVTILYFVSFTVISFLLMLNVFVAVVLQNFEVVKKIPGD